jgi:predicted enzyme related to lactoylglutathione lyase
MARVTGIGGVFFKAKGDPRALAEWYGTYLGLNFEPWGGAVLKWPEDGNEDRGLTVWHLAEPASEWFAPSTQPFMINYRVDDLAAIAARLETGGYPLLKEIEDHPNGRFAWVMDPDGNKVELWQPQPWHDPAG